MILPMTEEEKSKCRKIIHGHAVAAAAGNLVPVPGVGLATDTVTMTTMAMALAAAFGGSISESVAKNLAINAIIATIKRQPVRIIAKEVSKIMPIVGQLVAPSISVAMLESAGWLLAEELISERDKALSGDNKSLPPSKDAPVFKYDSKFKTHEEYVEEHEHPKAETVPADGGHLFKYDTKFKGQDDTADNGKN